MYKLSELHESHVETLTKSYPQVILSRGRSVANEVGAGTGTKSCGSGDHHPVALEGAWWVGREQVAENLRDFSPRELLGAFALAQAGLSDKRASQLRLESRRKNTRRIKSCLICSVVGHDTRTCPALAAERKSARLERIAELLRSRQ